MSHEDYFALLYKNHFGFVQKKYNGSDINEQGWSKINSLRKVGLVDQSLGHSSISLSTQTFKHTENDFIV